MNEKLELFRKRSGGRMKLDVILTISHLFVWLGNSPVFALCGYFPLRTGGTVLLKIKNIWDAVAVPHPPLKIYNRTVRVGDDIEIFIELAKLVPSEYETPNIKHDAIKLTYAELTYNVQKAKWSQNMGTWMAGGTGSGTIAAKKVTIDHHFIANYGWKCSAIIEDVNFDMESKIYSHMERKVVDTFDLVKNREKIFKDAFRAFLSELLCSKTASNPDDIPFQRDVLVQANNDSLFIDYHLVKKELNTVLLRGLGYSGQKTQLPYEYEYILSSPTRSDCLLLEDNKNDFSIAFTSLLPMSLIEATPKEKFQLTIDLTKNAQYPQTYYKDQYPNLATLMDVFRKRYKENPGKLIYSTAIVPPPVLLCQKENHCAATVTVKSSVTFQPKDNATKIEIKKYTTQISLKIDWNVAEDYDENSNINYFKISGQYSNFKLIKNEFEVVFKSGDIEDKTNNFNDDQFQIEMVGNYLSKMFKNSFRVVYPYHEKQRAKPSSFFTNFTSGVHCIYGQFVKIG